MRTAALTAALARRRRRGVTRGSRVGCSSGSTAGPDPGFTSLSSVKPDPPLHRLEDLRRVVADAALEDDLHVLDVLDACRRIAANDDEVRLFADGYGADLRIAASATDVRKATEEQVKSLGAKFVFADVADAATSGGYAQELSAEDKAKQAALVAEHIKGQDIVITTALIPGRPAPVLVTMLARS